MRSKTLLTPQLTVGNVADKRQEIKTYFNSTFAQYESLFEILVSELAFYERPCSLRHPLIFYFGHTATFFANKLQIAKLITSRVDPKLESLFAIGVDEMSWDDLDETHYEWPSVAQTKAYRDKIKILVNQLIDNIEIQMPITWDSPIWTIIMGIEHERIHLETSSVLIRQLDIKWVKAHVDFPECTNYGIPKANQWVDIAAGQVNIEHQNPVKYYAWDNEYGIHMGNVAEFKVADYLVSNHEFLAFVEAEGYQKEEYWSEEGKQWLTFSQAQHPCFWSKKENQWAYRNMTTEIPMPWNWPVDVNFLEAKAFCNWKSAETDQNIRLPSEDEYIHLRNLSDENAIECLKGNINLQQFASSTPIDANPGQCVHDIVGNVWQWCETPMYPYQGFKVHRYYDDFTAPTFDNQHNLLKGGSWISTGNEITPHSRYAFRRHFFQHAGFRYVASDNPVQTLYNTYETDSSVALYCEFHYGPSYFGVDNFAQAYAQYALLKLQGHNKIKALEVGCSVGRACFELASEFTQVTGLDFSARFIQLANQLKEDTLRYAIPEEGDIVQYQETSLLSLGLDDYKHRCHFMQQDACNLKPRFTGYDLILAANLIDRLYQPLKFLNDIHERINNQGFLIITSPYTWLEEFTEKRYWLGGYKDQGENVNTMAGLKKALSPHFELIETTEIPFVIRETARKFQHSIAEVSTWQKK